MYRHKLSDVEQKTLREWREDNSLTQEQLEERCKETPTARRKNINLNQTAISNIEIGRVVNPKWDTVCVLAEALKIDPRQIRFDSPGETQTRLPLKRKVASA